MTTCFLRNLAHTLFPYFTVAQCDDDASTAHEALHGDSAVIRLVCELRALEQELAADTSSC